MNYQFKRGIVTLVLYSNDIIDNLKRETISIVATDGSEYNVEWAIKSDSDLFGIGDKVSFLLYDDMVVNLRLNPF